MKKLEKLKREANVKSVARKVRRRSVGDGDGIDVGIANGVFGTKIVQSIDGLDAVTKKKLADHVREHGRMAIEPIVRLMRRDHGQNEADFVADVGLNMLRTIIEALEEGVDNNRRRR